jgi:glycosyltransferase involved in cell wall biosynthesis
MIEMRPPFPLISVIFVTFNRLETLRPTLSSFLAQTSWPRDRLELIVADDGSLPDVRKELQSMPFDRFALGENAGMGANCNRGIRAASGDYILQIQDDWVCLGPSDYLQRGILILEGISEVGMVLFNQHPKRPAIKSLQAIGSDQLRVYDNDLNKSILYVGQNAYSDWPHLKRRELHSDLGLYKENVSMHACELDFAQRIGSQTKHYIADIAGLDVFKHIGGKLSYQPKNLKGYLADAIEGVYGGAMLKRYNEWKFRRLDRKSIKLVKKTQT